MEELNNKPINSERLAYIKRSIDFKKNYLLALHRRLGLIKKDFSKKDEFQRNEIAIIEFETLAKINNAERYILDKEKEYKVQSDIFYEDLENLHRNYNSIIAQARSEQSENSDVKDALNCVNWKQIEENVDEKILLFKYLKSIINYQNLEI